MIFIAWVWRYYCYFCNNADKSYIRKIFHLCFHHLIIGSDGVKNKCISSSELTHFFSVHHPFPKTISFEGQKHLINHTVLESLLYRYHSIYPRLLIDWSSYKLNYFFPINTNYHPLRKRVTL